MLNRLRLLGFLIACVITGNVCAEDNPNQPNISEPQQAKTTAAPSVTAGPSITPAPSITAAPAITATPSAVTPKEVSEPKVFDPIGLPKPIVTETVTKPVVAEASVVEPVAPKIVTETLPATKPIKNKKAIKPKTIAIKSDAVAHPVVIETVALPGQVTSSTKAKPEEAIKAGEESPETMLPQQTTTQALEAMQPEYAHQSEESAPVYINTAAPIVESSKNNKQCANATNRFQKSLLVMAFPRLTPTSSSAGELSQAEHQLPQLLSELLVNKHSTIAPQQINQALPSADASNEAQLSLLIQRLASNHRSQFILSGEIVDMSMATPNATYNPGLYTRGINKFFDVIEAKNRFDKRDRLFSFQVHLRDGFTGQELLTKRYDTYGIWGYAGKVGFGTPLFWKSDYGQQIKGLVNLAANDLSQAINCQPFIAQIDSRPGQTQFILQSGANNGLHTGDMLSLYQLIIQGSETRYQEHDVRLVNRNLAIELREVYASHSVGVINGTTYLTGKLVAVAP